MYHHSTPRRLLIGLLTYFISFVIQAASTSPWQFQFGPRYWYSSARYRENLQGNPGIMVSRLTYDNLSANAAEGFWKLGHQNGLYLKGYFGGGSINGGQLIDEDFPPGISPYSRTISPQKNGALSYFNTDLGYNLFTTPNWRLGGFVGYHYWQEQVDNFGCTQTANGPICVSPIADSVNTLNNSAVWNSLRLGVNGEVHWNTSWSLETDLAYIHSSLNEYDFHNLRPAIRGLLDTGTGNGFQLDAILNYSFTDELSIGIGGRWWYLVTNGWAHFEQIATPDQPQPIDGIQNRYGLLIQANYQFMDQPVRSKDKDDIDVDWRGTYVGANIGYGTNPSMVNIYPTSTTTQILQYNALSPFSLNVQNAGFLSGGQLGYNWQKEHILWGLEADLDYTQLGGANAVTSSLPLTTTVEQNIRWLSTLRGRIGQLASPSMLVYLTGGAAWGGVTLGFDQRDVATSCALSPVCMTANQNSTQTGWIAGAGVEYAVAPRLTFKAEYLYLNLGSFNIAPADIDAAANYIVNTDFEENVLRLGINYKMNAV